MNPLVLVIDGDIRTSKLLLGTAPLSDTRFDVRAAADRARALELIDDRMPDLLIISADSTNGNAWDAVLGSLRSAGCTAPAIVVTRETEVGNEDAFQLGVRDVLQKPLSAPNLRMALNGALRDVRYRKEQAPLKETLQQPEASAAQPAPDEIAAAAAREFDVLYAIGKSVTSLTHVDQILHRVVEAAVYLARAEQGALMLVEPSGDELVIRAAKNFDERLARTLRLRAQDGIAGEVLRSGKSMLIGGAQRTKIKTSFLVRAALYVPLRIGERRMGVLTVDNQLQERTFTLRHQRLLEALADYAAIAIRNAQLLAESRSRNAALEAAVHELRTADQIKDAMVQNLSHELRTPLVFVKGFLHMLHAGQFGELPAEVKQGLDTALARVDDLVKIIENTMAISDPEQFALELRPVVVQDLIRAVVKKSELRAAQAHVTIVTDVLSGPIVVSGDRRYLEQVLNNLIDNAVKFSPNGGLITVSASLHDDSSVEVAVSDTGVGIAPDHLQRIFERFYQVDASATRRFGGTGLGLPAARQIIEAHGGQLTVESRLGVGSTFQFTLPTASRRTAPFVAD